MSLGLADPERTAPPRSSQFLREQIPLQSSPFKYKPAYAATAQPPPLRALPSQPLSTGPHHPGPPTCPGACSNQPVLSLASPGRCFPSKLPCFPSLPLPPGQPWCFPLGPCMCAVPPVNRDLCILHMSSFMTVIFTSVCPITLD